MPKKCDDCSGRAVKGVHVDAYGDDFSIWGAIFSLLEIYNSLIVKCIQIICKKISLRYVLCLSVEMCASEQLK